MKFRLFLAAVLAAVAVSAQDSAVVSTPSPVSAVDSTPPAPVANGQETVRADSVLAVLDTTRAEPAQSGDSSQATQALAKDSTQPSVATADDSLAKRPSILVIPAMDAIVLGIRAPLVQEALLRALDERKQWRILTLSDSNGCHSEVCLDSLVRTKNSNGTARLEYVLRESVPMVRLVWLDPTSGIITASDYKMVSDTLVEKLQAVPPALLQSVLTPSAVQVATPAAPVVEPRLAVLLFTAEGAATDRQARLFTDSLYKRLQQFKAFTLLDMEQRDSLLQGWEPGACRTLSCRIEAASRLHSTQLLTGTIRRIGDQWEVRAELITGDSGVVLRHWEINQSGSAGLAQSLLARSLGAQVSGKEKGLDPAFGDVVVDHSRGSLVSRIIWMTLATGAAITGVVLSW